MPTMAAAVVPRTPCCPPPQRRRTQQSANLLRNRSTQLKLEKTILITIIFTIMCTTCRQRQCGCRRRCLQPRMNPMRRFRCNSSVLWNYCHRPVPWFPRRRLGRQSKYGQRGGDLGGWTTAEFYLNNKTLCGVVHSAHPHNGLRPNRAHAASPMVWG